MSCDDPRPLTTGASDPAHLATLTRLDLREGLPFVGALYVQRQRASVPSWQAFVNDGLADADAIRLQNRHAGALLVLRIAKHWFAIPFGFGRHLVNDDAIERGFGLRATLNSVDPEHLRSVDLSTIEEMRLHTETLGPRLLSRSMATIGNGPLARAAAHGDERQLRHQRALAHSVAHLRLSDHRVGSQAGQDRFRFHRRTARARRPSDTFRVHLAHWQPAVPGPRTE